MSYRIGITTWQDSEVLGRVLRDKGVVVSGRNEWGHNELVFLDVEADIKQSFFDVMLELADKGMRVRVPELKVAALEHVGLEVYCNMRHRAICMKERGVRRFFIRVKRESRELRLSS